MKQKLEQRLEELRSEFESGQKSLADLEVKQTKLRNTLLRISGAKKRRTALAASVDLTSLGR